MLSCVKPNLIRTLAWSSFVIVLTTTPATAQDPAADSSLVINAYNAATLQKKLNEAASAGYRVSRAFAANGLLNPLADVFLSGAGATSEPLLTLEKIPASSAKYEYAVVKFPRTPSGWEHDLNKAAADGFRVIPGNTLTLSEGFILGSMDVPISILEKGPTATEEPSTHYLVISVRGMKDFERDVSQHLIDGYSVLWLGHWAAEKLALMEKIGSEPVDARLVGGDRDIDLQQRLQAAASEHFCVSNSMTRVEGGRQTIASSISRSVTAYPSTRS